MTNEGLHNEFDEVDDAEAGRGYTSQTPPSKPSSVSFSSEPQKVHESKKVTVC